MGCATKIPVKSLRLKKTRRARDARESSSSESESPGCGMAKIAAISKKMGRSKKVSTHAMDVDIASEKSQPEPAVVADSFEAEAMKSSDQSEMIVAITKVLEQFLSAQQGKSTTITRFHGVSAPPKSLTVDAYLARLRKYFDCSQSCLLTAMIYIDRIVKLNPAFPLCERTIHRVIGVSMMVAAKFHDDTFYANTYYAKVCGLAVREMNALETDFLKLLAWKCDISPAEYADFQSRVSGVAKR